MFYCRVGIGSRRVHDGNATLGGCGHVDVVDAGTSTCNQPELSRRLDQLGSHLRSAADDQRRLPNDASRELLTADPSPGQVPESDVTGALRETLGQTELNQLIDEAVDQRRDELVSERSSLREKLRQRDDSDDAWWRGLDRINLASRDILSIAVYFPG